MKSIFKISEGNIEEKFNLLLNNLPSISEVQEILMIYKLYEISFGKTKPTKELDSVYKYLSKYNPSKYSNFTGMFGRLNSLYIKTRVNFEVFHEVMNYRKNVFLSRKNRKHSCQCSYGSLNRNQK